MNPREGFFTAKGVRLHYLDWGGAGQNITLLAGLGDTAQIYRGLASRLADHFRVVGLTRRGHGRSDKPASGYNLDTFVADINHFLDALAMERTILVGHSFAGLEMPRFAVRFPERVEAVIFLDALFPKLPSEPDFSDDPTLSLLPTSEPSAVDLESRQAYMAYCRNTGPAWAKIWCPSFEADLMDRVSVNKDGTLTYHHDDALMLRFYENVWLSRNPEFRQINAPMLAIVPDGDYHQLLPAGATEEQRLAADMYWLEKIRPWLRQRTALFRRQAPAARVVELDSPYHHIFIAEETETAKAIIDFLAAH